MKKALRWIAAAAAILVGAWIIATVAEIAATQKAGSDARAELAAEVKELDEQSDANAAALAIANEKLLRAGKSPVAEPEPGDTVPDVIEGQPGPKGERGESCIEEIGRPACVGDDGTDGANGTNGADGNDGAAGAQGDTGAQGEPGPVGPQGPAGPMGPEGPQGPQGPAGKDATLPTGTASCHEGQYVTAVTLTADGLSVVCATPALVPIS